MGFLLVKLEPLVQVLPLSREYATEVTVVPLAATVIVAEESFEPVPRRAWSQLEGPLPLTIETDTFTVALQIAQLSSLHSSDFTYPQ